MPVDVQGVMAWDRYAYVNNSPVKYNDPSGHDVGCPGMDAATCYSRPIIAEMAQQGNIRAIQKLLTPTHGGVRLQGEASLGIGPVGISGSIGVNIVYNQVSGELVANSDWSVTPGVGLGIGGSGTIGFLLGWGSSTVDDVTSGYSALLSGSAAAQFAGSAALIAPLEGDSLSGLQGLHVDPLYGQVPATVYLGAGAGGAYADAGGGISGPVIINETPLQDNLFSLFSGAKSQQHE